MQPPYGCALYHRTPPPPPRNLNSTSCRLNPTSKALNHEIHGAFSGTVSKGPYNARQGSRCSGNIRHARSASRQMSNFGVRIITRSIPLWPL